MVSLASSSRMVFAVLYRQHSPRWLNELYENIESDQTTPRIRCLPSTVLALYLRRRFFVPYWSLTNHEELTDESGAFLGMDHQHRSSSSSSTDSIASTTDSLSFSDWIDLLLDGNIRTPVSITEWPMIFRWRSSSSYTLVIVFELFSTASFAAAYLSCCVPSIRLSVSLCVCVLFSRFSCLLKGDSPQSSSYYSSSIDQSKRIIKQSTVLDADDDIESVRFPFLSLSLSLSCDGLVVFFFFSVFILLLTTRGKKWVSEWMNECPIAFQLGDVCDGKGERSNILFFYFGMCCRADLMRKEHEHAEMRGMNNGRIRIYK